MPPLSVELSIKASVSSSSLVHAANRCIHRVNGAMVATERRLRLGGEGKPELNEEETNVVKYSCFMLVREHIKCSLCLTQH